MRVRVKLFAQLRELAGAGDLTCEVTAPATTADVWRALSSVHPAIAPFERTVSCAVNAQYARMRTPVQADDEVAFLPPVSGG